MSCMLTSKHAQQMNMTVQPRALSAVNTDTAMTMCLSRTMPTHSKLLQDCDRLTTGFSAGTASATIW